MIPALEGVIGAMLVGVSIVQANGQHPDTTSWWARGKTLAMGISAMWLVLSVVLTMAPVVRDMSAIVAPAGPGQIQVRMSGAKVRDCKWLGSEAYIIDAAGTRHEASLSWLHDSSPGSSKPPGRYRWGPALIGFEPAIQAAQVEIVATHSCGWMWHEVRTTSGPWAVPR